MAKGGTHGHTSSLSAATSSGFLSLSNKSSLLLLHLFAQFGCHHMLVPFHAPPLWPHHKTGSLEGVLVAESESLERGVLQHVALAEIF